MPLTPEWTDIREFHGGENRIGLTRERLKFWKALRGKVAREYVCPAGRRALKTIIVTRFMVTELLEMKPDRNFFIGAPTQHQVKRLYWNRIKRLVPREFMKGPPKESDLCIETKWGSTLWLKGLDVMQRVEGTPWDGIAIDEIADVRASEIPVHIYPMLPERDAYLIWLGVPDMNGIGQEQYEEIRNQALRGELRDREVSRILAHGGPRLPVVEYFWPSCEVMNPTEIERLRGKMSPAKFRQEFEGSFERPEDVAFPDFSDDLDGNIQPTPFEPGKAVFVACDFNYPHHRWVLLQLDDAVKPWRARCFDQVALENAPVAKMCVELVSVLSRHLTRDWKNAPLIFYGDFAGVQRKAEATYTAWETIREYFPNAQTRERPNPAIADRITTTNGFLCAADGKRRVVIDPRCTYLIADLRKVTRKMLLTASGKAGTLTHSVDGLGYFLTFHDRFL